MKSNRIIISLVIIVILFAGLIVSCDYQEVRSRKDMIELPMETETVEMNSRSVFESENGLKRISCSEDVLMIDEYGKQSILNLYHSEEGKIMPEEVYFSYSIQLEDEEYVLLNDRLLCDEEEIELPEDNGCYFPLGFWVWEEVPYLAAIKIVYDSVDIDIPVSQEFMLFPLGRMLGKPIVVNEINADIAPVGYDGTWNYWVKAGMLCRTDGEVIQELGHLSQYGVDNLKSFAVVGDTSLLVTEKMVIVLEQGEAETQSDKGSSLIMGAFEAQPDLKELIAEFNLNSESKIILKEFQDQVQLNLAVLSGEVDMIAGGNGEALMKFAKQGYLVPMDDLIGDVLESGALFENAVKALEIRGKTYLIFPSFRIIGMILPKSVVEEMGEPQSISALIQVLDTLEDQSFYRRSTREFVIRYFFMNGIDEWVNLEQGSCSFETESFLELLAFVSRYAADKDEMQANKADDPSLFSPYHEINRAISDNLCMQYEINGTGKPFSKYSVEGALIPLPTQKTSGFAFDAEEYFAVLASSKEKGLAEVFIRWILSTEYQRKHAEKVNVSYGITIRKDVYEELTQKWMEEFIASSSYPEEEARRMAECIYMDVYQYAERADHVTGTFYRDIFNIIEEETAPYFAGDKDAETTAAHIQSRVSIFLAEQS